MNSSMFRHLSIALVLLSILTMNSHGQGVNDVGPDRLTEPQRPKPEDFDSLHSRYAYALQNGIITNKEAPKPVQKPLSIDLPKISLEDGLDKSLLGLQVAKCFRESRFVPQSRVEFFAWGNRADMAFTGWLGHIKSIRQTADGVIVEVFTKPRLMFNGNARTIVVDSFREIYRLDKDFSLTYLGGSPEIRDFPGKFFTF